MKIASGFVVRRSDVDAVPEPATPAPLLGNSADRFRAERRRLSRAAGLTWMSDLSESTRAALLRALADQCVIPLPPVPTSDIQAESLPEALQAAQVAHELLSLVVDGSMPVQALAPKDFVRLTNALGALATEDGDDE